MEYTRLSHDTLIEFAGAAGYLESVNPDECVVFGAVENNIIYGILVVDIRNRIQSICYLYVVPEKRRQGIATRLIQLADVCEKDAVAFTSIAYSESMVEDITVINRLFEQIGFFINVSEENVYRINVESVKNSLILKEMKSHVAKLKTTTPRDEYIPDLPGLSEEEKAKFMHYFQGKSKSKHTLSRLLYDNNYSSYAYMLTTLENRVLYIDYLLSNNRMAALSTIVSLEKDIYVFEDKIDEIQFVATTPKVEQLVEKLLQNDNDGVKFEKLYNAVRI